ncbi:microfibrillar-associated protein 5 isoform X2 [Cricetulus griseus]|uniref:Microfibrillar-associated protein 5 isoform X2 n=1 Tax=Cricetulus griseus TaxID=10029 RepID=A0A9J7H3L2_CRIGR|nr:microfibrillar-associated protein 5 isoform X2 [Cricetulus griseus]
MEGSPGNQASNTAKSVHAHLHHCISGMRLALHEKMQLSLEQGGAESREISFAQVEQRETVRRTDTFGSQRTQWTERSTVDNMMFFRPKPLLLVMVLIIPSDDVIESFTEDPNLVNDPSTDETVLADITPSTDDLASASDKNTTAECRDEKFACTRLYSVHRPVKQCVHQVCFTSLRRMYIINNEICSRLVCKEHEAMKDELCRQMAGLPPRRLRRSNYFRLPPCENMNLQRPSGL